MCASRSTLGAACRAIRFDFLATNPSNHSNPPLPHSYLTAVGAAALAALRNGVVALDTKSGVCVGVCAGPGASFFVRVVSIVGGPRVCTQP